MTTTETRTTRPAWATLAGIGSITLAFGVLLYGMGFVGLGAAATGIGLVLTVLALVGLAGAAAMYFFSRRA